MGALRLFQLESQQALAAHQAEWDRLWSASAATLPTLTAQNLGCWLSAFAPRRPFRALVVADERRWLAALPLVAGWFKGLVPAGVSPSNDWGLAFDLLLADDAGTNDVLNLLAHGLAELPWSCLSLHHALLHESRWRQFRAACERVGIAGDWRPQLEIARVTFQGDWAAYRATWSKSHRRHLQGYERGLAQLGPVSCEWHETIAPEALGPLLDRARAIEQQGWKGAQGTALAHDATAWPYLQAQMNVLAAAGHLRFAFLRAGQRDVAFDCGWLAKGVYYSFKVAYDAQLAHAAPSHVLTGKLLEQFHATPGMRAFDFLCPLAPAVAHWRPTTYTVGRALLAPRGVTGSLVVRAQQALAPALAASV